MTTQSDPQTPSAPQAPRQPWWWIAAITGGLTTWVLTHEPGLAIAVTSLIADMLRPHE